MWQQVYNPLHSDVLSTIAAAVPVVTLLVLIATGAVKTHIAALIALAAAILVAVLLFTMPWGLALRAAFLGALIGFFPIGWIVLNVIFMYPLTAAILIGLGFSPLAASGLSLIANTAPVAYGALGTPIAGLASVTGLDPYLLGAMVGRQLPFFSLIVPFWLIWAFAGWRGMKDVWPAILICGVSFAVPQFLISNFVNPWIVDIGASLVSMACLVLFLKVWHPKELWLSPALRSRDESAGTMPAKTATVKPVTSREMWLALLPWIIVCGLLLVWGTNAFLALVYPWATCV